MALTLAEQDPTEKAKVSKEWEVTTMFTGPGAKPKV